MSAMNPTHNMTDAEVERMAFESARAQGLPDQIEDPIVLRRIVELLAVVSRRTDETLAEAS